MICISKEMKSRHEYYLQHRDEWKRYRRNRMLRKPLYTVWHGMLVRTGVRKGAKDHEIRDYIKRGIGVCDEWMSYQAFESWALDHGWRLDLRIDRIDNSKGYFPENCRFVTVSENQRNRRCCRFVNFRGDRMLFIEAYERSGCTMDYKACLSRLIRGWDIDRIFTEPLRFQKPRSANSNQMNQDTERKS